MPVTIEYIIDASELGVATDELARRISTLGGVLKASAQDIRLSVRERYDEEKSPDGTPWAPLAAATLARKKDARILIEGDVLRKSITVRLSARKTNPSLRMGSNLVYARIHQLGGKGRAGQKRHHTGAAVSRLLRRGSRARAARSAQTPAKIADDVRILPEGDPEASVAAFLRRFDGALNDGVYTDVIGERILVSEDMFRGSPDRRGIRPWKLARQRYKGREKWLEYLAQTIRDPVEIRAHMEPVRSEIKRGKQKYVTRRYYLRRVEFPEEGRMASRDFSTSSIPIREAGSSGTYR